MLFRAQIPVGLTSLSSPVDDRLLLVFECHARLGHESTCQAGEVIVTRGDGTPRSAPTIESFDVVVRSLGTEPAQVLRLMASLGQESPAADDRAPWTVTSSVPPSIAEQAVSLLVELGADAQRVSTSPTLLSEVRGGRLVPFDDGWTDTPRTTLPPLGQLRARMGGLPMRGLIGGSMLGRSDGGSRCKCGKRWRTAVRLLADESRTLAQVPLPPAVVQVCLDCDSGLLLRS